MKMVIGGAYQGKLCFAKEQYPEISWIDGETCTEEEVYSCQGICNFHRFLERSLHEEKNVQEIAEKLMQRNPDVVIVTDEIGYGIVPVDPFLREYREQTGRVCTGLAAFSEEVYRVVCGIGTRIK